MRKKTNLEKAQFQILKTQPFIASLMLEGQIVTLKSNNPQGVDTAATDGKNFYFNMAYVDKLDMLTRVSLIAHEVFHAALDHVTRFHKAELPDVDTANRAADIIVNQLVIDSGLPVPDTWVTRPEWSGFDLVEVYRLLRKEQEKSDGSGGGDKSPVNICFGDKNMPIALTPAETPNWGMAIRRAIMQSQIAGRGTDSKVIDYFKSQNKPQLNYKQVLRRYLSSQPVSYDGWDRKFTQRGLYIDAVGGESLNLNVIVDTSMSCADYIGSFMTEVMGMLNSYPYVKGNLHFFDTKAYGPYKLADWKNVKPEGGGGTTWAPVKEILETSKLNEFSVSIILTDGYILDLPQKQSGAVVWVITPGGEDSKRFDFGAVTRLSNPAN